MIENDIKELWHGLNTLRGEVLKLKSDFEKKLAVDLDKWREYYSLLPTNNKKPYKCPLCMSAGYVFDITNEHVFPWPNSEKIKCPPCSGSGIVWG